MRQVILIHAHKDLEQLNALVGQLLDDEFPDLRQCRRQVGDRRRRPASGRAPGAAPHRHPLGRFQPGPGHPAIRCARSSPRCGAFDKLVFISAQDFPLLPNRRLKDDAGGAGRARAARLRAGRRRRAGRAPSATSISTATAAARWRCWPAALANRAMRIGGLTRAHGQRLAAMGRLVVVDACRRACVAGDRRAGARRSGDRALLSQRGLSRRTVLPDAGDEFAVPPRVLPDNFRHIQWARPARAIRRCSTPATSTRSARRPPTSAASSIRPPARRCCRCCSACAQAASRDAMALRIAFIIRDPLPPTRADVLTLFGAEMPRYGIGSELVGQRGAVRERLERRRQHASAACAASWPASPARSGMRSACGALRAPGRSIASRCATRSPAAWSGGIAAAMLGVPFVYWMSFPIVEGFEVRRDEIGRSGRGLAWAAHALRARLSRLAIYRLVLPGARHVFVQSDAMAAWLAGAGRRARAHDGGADGRGRRRCSTAPRSSRRSDARLDGRRVIVYLGRVAQSRQSGLPARRRRTAARRPARCPAGDRRRRAVARRDGLDAAPDRRARAGRPRAADRLAAAARARSATRCAPKSACRRFRAARCSTSPRRPSWSNTWRSASPAWPTTSPTSSW